MQKDKWISFACTTRLRLCNAISESGLFLWAVRLRRRRMYYCECFVANVLRFYKGRYISVRLQCINEQYNGQSLCVKRMQQNGKWQVIWLITEARFSSVRLVYLLSRQNAWDQTTVLVPTQAWMSRYRIIYLCVYFVHSFARKSPRWWRWWWCFGITTRHVSYCAFTCQFMIHYSKTRTNRNKSDRSIPLFHFSVAIRIGIKWVWKFTWVKRLSDLYLSDCEFYCPNDDRCE